MESVRTDPQYDDYANVDVKDKIVLIMRYSPTGDNPHSDYGKFLPLRYKTLTAREKGAKALLVVTGSADDSTDELIRAEIRQFFQQQRNSGLQCLPRCRRRLAPSCRHFC